MNHRASSRLRLATTIVLSYLMSLFILLFIAGMVLLQTALNPSFMVEQIDNIRFSEEKYDEIREIFISYASASGIPHDVMLEGLTHRRVDDAVKASVYAAFSVGAAYDFARYENELFELFHAYAIEQGFEPSDELDEGIRDLAELSMEAFAQRTNLGIFSFIAQTLSGFQRNITIAIAVSAAFTILAAALLPLINKRVTRWIDGYIYALGAVTLFCAALPIITLGTRWTGRLNITPMSFNRLISAWLDGIIYGFAIALIPVLLLLAICVIIRIVRKRRRRGYY